MLITSQRREGKSINRSLTLFSAKIFRNHLAFFTGRFPLVFFINIATRGYDSPSLVFISPPPQSPSHKLYILETKFRSVFEFFCFLLSWNYYKLMFHFLNEKYKIKFMKILTRHVGSFFTSRRLFYFCRIFLSIDVILTRRKCGVVYMGFLLLCLWLRYHIKSLSNLVFWLVGY